MQVSKLLCLGLREHKKVWNRCNKVYKKTSAKCEEECIHFLWSIFFWTGVKMVHLQTILPDCSFFSFQLYGLVKAAIFCTAKEKLIYDY